MKSLQTLLVIITSTVGLWGAAVANAAPIVSFGDVVVLANSRSQTVPILVSGGDSVQGLNLNLSVEKGGTQFSPDGKPGPRITNVNLQNNTIFSGNNDGQTNIASFPQAWAVSTATATGTVRADGVLAWVTFDTTGFAANSGPYSLSLRDPSGTPTDFAGVPAQITDGQLRLTFVPEPTSIAYLATGCALCLLARKRPAKPIERNSLISFPSIVRVSRF